MASWASLVELMEQVNPAKPKLCVKGQDEGAHQ
jgi:hypothetical protein